MDSNNISTALINVEKLENEYEVILKQYQEALNNYIQELEKKTDNITKFVQLPNKSYWGTGELKSTIVKDVGECESLCANDNNCSGATYNSSYPYCWTRVGSSILTTSKEEEGDIAIIPSVKMAALNLKHLNTRLIELNNEIIEEMKKITPETDKQNNENDIKNAKIQEYSNKLLEQQKSLDKQINEYNSTISENVNNKLIVNKEYTAYIYWLLITLLLTVYVLFGHNLSSNFNNIFIIIISILILFLLDITAIFNNVLFIFSYIFKQILDIFFYITYEFQIL